MKQKTKPSNNLVTKEFFKRELKIELKKFATKDDLTDFKIEVFAELSRAELKALDREQAYHSDVMTKFDKIMKKLETKDQEDEVGNFQTKERIDDHEKRITSLESA